VTRLVDTEPALVRRVFARQAQLQMKQRLLAMSEDSSSMTDEQAPRRLPGFLQDGILRVGYLSGLPAGHVTYDLVGSMLRFHTDKHLKVYWCTAAAEVAPVKRGDAVRGGLKVPHEHVVELSRMTSTQAAARLRQERIGVLVDLDGWIGDEPPRLLLGSRPAPVRAQWLGWAGTTADPSIHHIVTDNIISPCMSHVLYRERLLLLPRSYQLNDHAQLYSHLVRPASTRSASSVAVSTREAAGATRSRTTRALTISNFNQLMKISPDIFAVWSGAMRRTRSVRLLLLTGVTSVHVAYPSAARNLRAELALQGLRGARLQHAGVMRKAQHLLRAAGCHLGIDTLSYNSHTTGADSLWSGLPLLTLPGLAFSARVGASLVSSSGLPGMRVASLKAYEDSVAELATATWPTESVAHSSAQLQRPPLQRPIQRPPPRALAVHPGFFWPSEQGSFGTFSLSWDSSTHLQTDYLRGPRPLDSAHGHGHGQASNARKGWDETVA